MTSNDFVDPAAGFSMVADCPGDYSHRCTVGIGRTRDGGRTWQPVRVLHLRYRGRGPHDELAEGLAFANRKVGWLFGSRTLVTRDGGTTWIPQRLPPTAVALEVARGTAWVLAGRCPSGCPLRLFTSGVGGFRWRPTPSQPGDFREARLVALTDRDAFVLGVRRLVGSPPGILAATHDGGSSWRLTRAPCGPHWSDLVAADVDRLWLACAEEPTSTYEAGTLYRSVDGGRSWRLAARTHGYPFHPRRGVPDFPSFGTLGEVSVVSGGGLLMSRDTALTRVLLSVDGGRHWRSVLSDGGGGADLQFVDPNHGWAFSWGPNRLYRTVDGGRHWTVVARTRS
jgi:photosystem II stability/assembly factor-like uncharacterized protein